MNANTTQAQSPSAPSTAPDDGREYVTAPDGRVLDVTEMDWQITVLGYRFHVYHTETGDHLFTDVRDEYGDTAGYPFYGEGERVLHLPGHVALPIVEAAVRAWFDAFALGRREGRRQLQNDLRGLLGAAAA